MRAFVLDRSERTGRIESVRRDGQVLTRKNAQYAMRGVSWAWSRPMYPRWIWFLSFIPFIGPFISNYILTRDTFVFIATGIPFTLEAPSEDFVPSMTDQQAKVIFEAQAEIMGIGSRRFDPMLIALLIVGLISVIAIVGLFR